MYQPADKKLNIYILLDNIMIKDNFLLTEKDHCLPYFWPTK